MSPLKIRLSAPDLAALEHLTTMLHLAHHRNKNQHRRASWYRHFNILRRHLDRLLGQYKTLNSVPDTFSARHRKKAEDKLTETSVEEELGFLGDHVLPKAWHSFSQLVADVRYAVLGVVLLGALAEAGKLTGVTAMIDEEAQRDVEEALHRFGKDHWRDVQTGPGVAGLLGQSETGSEDVGEIIKRDENQEMDDSGLVLDDGSRHAEEKVALVSAESEPSQSKAPPYPQDSESDRREPQSVAKRKAVGVGQAKTKKKKKRKVGDVIDDLFAGL